ncbi:hypothetical protein SH449x_001384 [Pirellulaceae bacterium SH449]
MRFTLLKHKTTPLLGRSDHLDLLLQTRSGESPDDRSLMAFELPLQPTYWGTLLVRRLPMHRQLFLDYSGELSGGRGCVSLIETGPMVWQKNTEMEVGFSLTLKSAAWAVNSGTWRFHHQGDNLWKAEHRMEARE